MRQIVLLLAAVAASALTACGTTKINSPQYLNGYGDFESSTGYLPTTEQPGKEWVLFSQGIATQERAKADSKRVQLSQARIEAFAALAQQQAQAGNVAAIVEAVVRARRDDLTSILAYCSGTTWSDPAIMATCKGIAGMVRTIQESKE